jgi:hypothetical protein
MTEVTYKQGMTTVWSDGEKVVITNPSQRRHIKANVEQIFGMGEYDKLYAALYTESETINPGLNTLSKTIEITSGYIPERVTKDLLDKKTPGIKESDLFDRSKLK